MSAMVTDRLWPVLLALVALLGGAIALEQYAGVRGNEPLVISVRDAEVPASAPEDEDGEPVAAWSAPVSPGHAQARTEAQRGNLRTALELFAQEAKQHPDSAPLEDEYGFWLLSDGDEAKALVHLERARALAPNDPGVALHLGQAHARAGQGEKAEAELRRALTLKPGFGAAQRALGRLLRKQKRNGEAIALLTEAAQSGGNEEKARALAELGAAQLASGQRDEAERAFERAIQYAPARVEIRIAVARAYLAGGDADRSKATELLERAAELAPDLPQVHSALARALERLGEQDRAVAAYEKALRLDPSYRYVRRRLLRVALDRKDFVRAKHHADALLADDAEEPEHHFLAALVADRDGRTDDARAEYRRAVEKAKGDYPEALLNLGLLEKRAGRVPEAIAAYREALAKRPDYVAAMNNLAVALEAKGDLAAAEAQLLEAIRTDPKYATAQATLGELYLREGKIEAAITAYRRAVELRPGHAGSQLGLVQALLAAKRHDEALATAKALVEREPRQVSGWLAVANAASAVGKLDEARGALARASALNPESREPLARLAELEQRSGSLEAAEAAWRELVERDPSDRTSQLGLVAVLARRGDLNGCVRTADLLLARSPDDSQAKHLRQQCAAGAPGAQP